MDPRQRMLELSSMGWLASALAATAELGVADHVTHEGREVDDIASELRLDRDALYRVLRSLAAYGVFTEPRPRTFALTPLANLLRQDGAESMRDIVRMMGAPWHWDAWKALEQVVRDGAPSAFERVQGTGLFDYLRNDDGARTLFHAAMEEFQQLNRQSVLEAYDFGTIGTLADVGGSHGELLAAILLRYQTMRGVLFDLPHVVEHAHRVLERLGVADRVDVVGGDFFADSPPRADAYLLSTIIHDWDDRQAAAILRRCAAGMTPDARVLLAERVLPPGDERSYGKLMDLEMLVLAGGRERTEAEFAALFDAAGLSLAAVWRSSTPMCVVEARPQRGPAPPGARASGPASGAGS